MVCVAGDGERCREEPSSRREEERVGGNQKRVGQVTLFSLFSGIGLQLVLPLHSLVHSVTKSMSEHADKLDDATKASITEALNEAKAVDASASLETIKASEEGANVAIV